MPDNNPFDINVENKETNPFDIDFPEVKKKVSTKPSSISGEPKLPLKSVGKESTSKSPSKSGKFKNMKGEEFKYEDTPVETFTEEPKIQAEKHENKLRQKIYEKPRTVAEFNQDFGVKPEENDYQYQDKVLKPEHQEELLDKIDFKRDVAAKQQQFLNKPEDNYLWAFTKGLNEGTIKLLNTLDGAGRLVNKILPGGNPFMPQEETIAGKAANYLKEGIESAETKYTTPKTVLGSVVEGAGLMAIEAPLMALAPETKLGYMSIGGIKSIPGIATYLGTTNALNTYQDLDKKNTKTIDKITETGKSFAGGFTEGLVMHGLGYISSKTGTLVKGLTDSNVLEKVATIGTGATTFGGLTAADQYASGKINTKEIAAQAILGGALTAMGVGKPKEGIKAELEARQKKAVNSFFTTKTEDIDNIYKIPQTVEQLREKQLDLEKQIQKETDPEVKEQMQIASQVLDNFIDVKYATKQLITDPAAVIDRIQKDETLSDVEKKHYTDKINEVVAKTDPRIQAAKPLTAEIEKTDANIEAIKGNESLSDLQKTHIIEGLENKKKDLSKSINEEMSKPIDMIELDKYEQLKSKEYEKAKGSIGQEGNLQAVGTEEKSGGEKESSPKQEDEKGLLNAEGVRKDEGEVQKGGAEPKVSKDESGQNLQFQEEAGTKTRDEKDEVIPEFVPEGMAEPDPSSAKSGNVEIGEKSETPKAMKKILATGENNVFSREVKKDGKELGEVHVEEKPEGWEVKYVMVNEKGKGYGKQIYRELNNQAQLEGKVVKSDRPDKISTDAKGLWDSLVKSGEAEKLPDNSYRMFLGKAEKFTGVRHASTEQTRKELGLGEYERTTKANKELIAKADAEIKAGYNIEKLLKDVDGGKLPTDVEQTILKQYISTLKEKIEKNPTDDLLKELKRTVEVSDKAGSEVARSLASRRGEILQEDTLADFFVREMENASVDKLTDAQKETVKKEFDNIVNSNKEYQEKIDLLEKEVAKLKSSKALDKLKGGTKGTKKDHAEYVSEREKIRQSIAEKWKQASNDSTLTAVPLPYSKQLAYIAPDVIKLAKSYIEEGIYGLKDVVTGIHKDLKDQIEGLTETDIHNIIAGEYKEAKETRSQKLSRLSDLREEAKLINKLEKIEQGVEPKVEKKKIERNQRITELRQQIKDLRKSKLEEGKPTQEEVSLKTLKTRSENEIKKIEEAIKAGNYAKEEKKVPILENKDIQKKYPKEFKEALDAKDRVIKARQDREIRMLKEKYANRTKLEKAGDVLIDVIGIPRTIMASMDFSAVLRQGLIPTVSHPMIAGRAMREMVKQTFSQKAFDRWLFDVKNADDYSILKDSGLYVADQSNPKLTAKEEQFMNNIAEKIPIIGSLIKGSERAYTSYLNKLRVDMFRSMVKSYEADGKMFGSNKELYKQTAKLINNETGRGSVGQFEEAAKVLNTVFFSPRLIASRVNLLTNAVNPKFYTQVPKEVRVQYWKDMAKFIGGGLTVLTLAKLAGAQVEDDARSADFGKIKIGNLRYDTWGGFQQYVRLFTQLYTGEIKSTTSGKIKKMGEGYNAKTRLETLAAFTRGKLAPVPATIADAMAGKSVTGEPFDIKDKALQMVVPLWAGDIADAVKDESIAAIFYVGVPNILGIGTQVYKAKDKSNFDLSNLNLPTKYSDIDPSKVLNKNLMSEYGMYNHRLNVLDKQVGSILDNPKNTPETIIKKLNQAKLTNDYRYYLNNSTQLDKFENVLAYFGKLDHKEQVKYKGAIESTAKSILEAKKRNTDIELSEEIMNLYELYQESISSRKEKKQNLKEGLE